MQTVVFDLDGCVIVDFGENYESEEFTFTPLVETVRGLRGVATLIAVTGRTVVPKEVVELFDEVITRPFPVEPFDTFMERYHKWKCETISEINPVVAYDDNKPVVDWLNANGIPAILIPSYKEVRA